MLRRISAFCLIGIVSTVLPLSAGAASATATSVFPCAHTTIAARKLPVGPAQYESGSLTLANGASMRLQGTRAELYRVSEMANGDPVAACYGPLKHYADAPPSRTITVLDLASGAYYGALIGTWKRH